MTLGLGIEPGPHWWKASALTTAPSLLPTISPNTLLSTLSFSALLSENYYMYTVRVSVFNNVYYLIRCKTFSYVFFRFLMGRDKSRAHLSHRIDLNVEQQLEALRQKLAEVSMT